MSDIVLATTSSFGKQSRAAAELLEARSLKLVVNPFGRKLTENELVELLAMHRPVGLLAGTEPVTEKALKTGLPELQVVSRIGVGWDNIDHEAARKHGILVFRTEGVLNAAVTELTLGMVLAALRNINQQDRELRAGIWNKRIGSLLGKRTVGIVGFGAIGKNVGKILSSLGATILFSDPVAKDSSWAKKVTLIELLQQADIVTIHASGNNQILGRKELEIFTKPGAGVVNTARGGMIDEEALFELLSKKEIAWACLDVFENEPYSGPLLNLDNVILSPHIGSYAKEARVHMEIVAVKNMLKAINSI